MSWYSETPQGVILHLIIQPKASRSGVVGLHGDPPRLKVRVAAPPVDGEANEELLRFLKKTLRKAGARYELLRGQSSKSKDILCVGVSLHEIKGGLGPGASDG